MRELRVNLPNLHSGQINIYKERTQLNVVRCGRRWGKTKLLETIAAEKANKGFKVGLFTPEYKQLYEPWEHIREYLSSTIVYTNKMVSLKTIKGGKIDFWRLNDNELAGRGFEYDYVLIDEAAFTKSPQMLDEIWKKSIKPTMLTTRGTTWVFSTPKGSDPDNFFYAICNDKSLGFKEFHAPTATNPYVPLDELEKEKELNDPLVFQQEYLAEFVDWSGVAFFNIEKMLINKKPVEYPTKCDGVFAVMDTAVKGGKEHDGTAVIYIAYNKLYGQPLIILDYDVVQIDGALLENWLPSVLMRLEDLAKETGARNGSLGVFIEDASAGSILLQQGRVRGWPTHKIDSLLTSKGKDERALDVSGYYHQEKIKISQYAFDKQVTFKGNTRNHLITQIVGFRIGDKDAYKRADDLLDCFVYSLAIAVGDKYGV